MLEKTTKYAIKALMHLASQSSDKYMQVSKLSKEVQVPGPYLSKIMKTLALKQIVITRKGINGGVKVTPKLKELTFLDIAVALEDPISQPRCLLNSAPCNPSDSCLYHKDWSSLREQVGVLLSKLKLVGA